MVAQHDLLIVGAVLVGSTMAAGLVGMVLGLARLWLEVRAPIRHRPARRRISRTDPPLAIGETPATVDTVMLMYALEHNGRAMLEEERAKGRTQ